MISIIDSYLNRKTSSKQRNLSKRRNQHVEKLRMTNPNVLLVGEYVNARTATDYYCCIHHKRFTNVPERVSNGVGCEDCTQEKYNLAKRKTTEQYIINLANRNSNLTVLEEYITNKTPILHRCNKHQIEWKIMPDSALRGDGCQKCKIEKIRNSKLKTHDQYIKELKDVNSMIIPCEEYIDCVTPILHCCLIHDVTWKISPNNALQGYGCQLCKSNKIKSKLTKTCEQYVEELSIVNPYVILTGSYINNSTPTEHLCLIHNVYWNPYPYSVLKGQGCKECGKEKLSKSLSLTHEQYCEMLSKKHKNIIPLENYKGSHIEILHKCLIDNYEWNIKPVNVLSNQGCPFCNNRIKRTSESYIEELNLCNNNLEVLEDYISINTPILHRCKKHNKTWKTSPYLALKGVGCSVCHSEKISNMLLKTDSQYKTELNRLNNSIESIEEYKGANHPIKHKCLICNNIWSTYPSNTLSGSGCPNCRKSHGEQIISTWLDNHNFQYIPQKCFEECKDIKLLPFDFYLPKENKCIEFDGEQHYRPIDYFGGEDTFMIQRWHDNIKDQFCDDYKIPLLRIRYDSNVEEELEKFLFV